MTVIVAMLKKVRRRLSDIATAFAGTSVAKAMVKNGPAVYRVPAPLRERAA